MLTRWLADPAATDQFATQLATALQQSWVHTPQAHWVVALEGGLGAGKSHLTRALLRALGVQGAIPSPTYSLLESYATQGPAAAHMDWYRLHDPLELEVLDWSGLCAHTPLILVEWASRIPALEATFDLRLQLAVESPGRRVDVQALSPQSKDLLQLIQDQA